MMDLENLAKQTELALGKVARDMTWAEKQKPGPKPILVLLGDILVMQTIQASLTLAFLERWADGEAETGT
jgi:hypothetical protein